MGGEIRLGIAVTGTERAADARSARPARRADARSARPARPPGPERRLLITSHLLDSNESYPRLAGTSVEAKLGLLGELVFGQAPERLPDRLRVLVVDADLQRAGVARLVGVDGLV